MQATGDMPRIRHEGNPDSMAKNATETKKPRRKHGVRSAADKQAADREEKAASKKRVLAKKQAATEKKAAAAEKRQAAREKAREFFRRFPKAAYMTEIESWRELPGDRIEFTMRRLPSAD